MEHSMRTRLHARGWRVGSTAEFLELTPEEGAFVETKLALSQCLRQRRTRRLQPGRRAIHKTMLTLALLVFGLLQAAAAQSGQNDVRATLERLETEWNVAHVRGDAATLDQIFSDDVVVIVPGMRVMTKADAVGMFRSGRMKFDKYETSETTFRTLDDTAIVTGRLKRTRVINGATVDDDWRFTKVYVHRAGRWQVISFHASNTGS